MNDILPNHKEPLILSDKDIITKIWASPRLVFKYINESHYDKYMIVLLALAGISRAFDRASLKNMGDTMAIAEILGICIVLGGLLGWVSYYIYAALLSWTGKWLDGKGDTNSILRILAYAMIPSILALILLIPQVGIYGAEIFKSEGDISSAGLISNIIVYSSMFLELALGICTLVFCVIGISEVQKLSIGKSILNLLLPALIILVPVLLIVLLMMM